MACILYYLVTNFLVTQTESNKNQMEKGVEPLFSPKTTSWFWWLCLPPFVNFFRPSFLTETVKYNRNLFLPETIVQKFDRKRLFLLPKPKIRLILFPLPKKKEGTSSCRKKDWLPMVILMNSDIYAGENIGYRSN